MGPTPPGGVLSLRSRRPAAALLLMAAAAAAAAVIATADGGGPSAAAATAAGGAPPPASDMDDPADAWAEWGETPESRRSGVRRRERPIEAGMNVDALLGMAGKTTKLFFTTLHPELVATDDEALALGGRYRNMLAAGGVTATFFADGKGGLICQAGSFRDAVNAKDFLIRQPEVALVALDAAKFTPLPPEDDDDDDDDGATAAGGGGERQPEAKSGGEEGATSAANASGGEGGEEPQATAAEAGLSVDSAAAGEAQVGGAAAKEEL